MQHVIVRSTYLILLEVHKKSIDKLQMVIYTLIIEVNVYLETYIFLKLSFCSLLIKNLWL